MKPDGIIIVSPHEVANYKEKLSDEYNQMTRDKTTTMHTNEERPYHKIFSGKPTLRSNFLKIKNNIGTQSQDDRKSSGVSSNKSFNSKNCFMKSFPKSAKPTYQKNGDIFSINRNIDEMNSNPILNANKMSNTSMDSNSYPRHNDF